jgi:Protein of unknown function (DUF2785)
VRFPDRALGAVLGWTLVAASGAAAAAAEPAKHPLEFWRQIKASDFAVPAGETPLPLLVELSDSLGSTDPDIRDGFGYEIPVAWIYTKKLLGPADLRVLLGRWTANLRSGIGDAAGDSVLLRSFSALDLSVLAAHDLQAPFLSPAEFDALLTAALAYLRDERDVRGYTPPVGWRHSCAHTADLLKFLARSPHLKAADHGRILDAVQAKVTRSGDPVYVWGEDERLARTLVSLVRRSDFDPALADPWLAAFTALHKKAWEGALPDPALLAGDRNAANLLKSFHTFLSQPAETAPAVAPVRAKVLATLAAY